MTWSLSTQRVAREDFLLERTESNISKIRELMRNAENHALSANNSFQSDRAGLGISLKAYAGMYFNIFWQASQILCSAGEAERNAGL